MRQIIIENNQARIVDITESYPCSIEDLVKKLETKPDFQYGPLPEGTAFVAITDNGNRIRILIGRPPGIRQVTTDYHHLRFVSTEDEGSTRTRLRHYTVSLPWLYWHFSGSIIGTDDISIDESYMYASLQKITSMSDMIYRVPLPNLYSDARICWGSSSPDSSIRGLARLDVLVNEYFNTEFNDDLYQPVPRPFTSMTEWQAATAAEKNTWTKLNLDPMGILSDQFLQPHLIANPQVTITIPPPPESFTIGRAREWMNSIPERDRRVILNALATFAEPEAE